MYFLMRNKHMLSSGLYAKLSAICILLTFVSLMLLKWKLYKTKMSILPSGDFQVIYYTFWVMFRFKHFGIGLKCFRFRLTNCFCKFGSTKVILLDCRLTSPNFWCNHSSPTVADENKKTVAQKPEESLKNKKLFIILYDTLNYII